MELERAVPEAPNNRGTSSGRSIGEDERDRPEDGEKSKKNPKIPNHIETQEPVPEAPNNRISIYLPPRSCIWFYGESRFFWKHGIAFRKTDIVDGQIIPRGRRVSLTFRKVKAFGQWGCECGEEKVCDFLNPGCLQKPRKREEDWWENRNLGRGIWDEKGRRFVTCIVSGIGCFWNLLLLSNLFYRLLLRFLLLRPRRH